MPVPAKFSEQSHDRVGHQFIEELVDWLTRNEQSFRTELREINELNFARFETKLELQVQRFENAIEKQGSQLRREMADMEARITGRLLRWMFVFWTGTTITVLGAMFAITRL
jgi:hypothetical protein